MGSRVGCRLSLSLPKEELPMAMCPISLFGLKEKGIEKTQRAWQVLDGVDVPSLSPLFLWRSAFHHLSCLAFLHPALLFWPSLFRLGPIV